MSTIAKLNMMSAAALILATVLLIDVAMSVWG